MGKVVEKIAIKRGHSVVGIINKEITDLNISDADVAIDFSVPSAAENNIKHSLNNNIPIVSGTTGWLENFNRIKNLCINKNGSFLYAPNFSLGPDVTEQRNCKLFMTW